jgi:DNA-binding CsgD family transcriptional regulator
VVIGNRRARVPDLVGMGYLAELLTHPGQEIPALTLASQGSAPRDETRYDVLDDTARNVYAARARELSAEVAEAEAHNDIARRERLQDELDALVDQLEAAAGLGGRPRAFTDSTERARTAVHKAIRRALDAIDRADPVIAEALRRTICTGTSCVYRPESRLLVVWTTGRSPAHDQPDVAASMVEVEPAPEVTIGDWFHGETGRHFVGRTAELDLAHTALKAVDPPFSVLYLHGPGGIGKTALLDRLAAFAGPTGRRVVRLDLHTVEPTPTAVLAAFAASLGWADGDVTCQMLADGGRLMVLIDTVELGEPLLAWLRDELVASLASGSLVVIAGRNPPPSEWLGDPAWRALSRVVVLDNLSEDEVGRYLQLHGVTARLHPRLFALTRGHPLALSLVVDLLRQRTEREHDVTDLMDTPEVVRTLMHRFVGEIPDSSHREALAVCAHARFTTEDLLRSGMGVDDARDLFEWLRLRPFIEEGRHGLFPHDLARDVLDTDLRWRDRIGYQDLHVRIRAHLFGRIRASTGAWQQQAATDVIYLHRLNPIMRPLFDWPHLGNVRVEHLSDSDHALVLEMTERRQGADQADLAHHWLDRQPAAFRIFRTADEVVGYVALLRLHDATAEEIAADPGTSALWDYAMTHNPPRPGEKITGARFAVDRVHHQQPAASFEGLSITHILHTATTPGLTWDFIAPWQSVDIEPMMNHIGYHRLPEAEFDIGGRHHFAFACDWRLLPRDDVVEMMRPWELDDDSTPPIRLQRRLADHVQPGPRDPGAVLSPREREIAALVAEGLTNREIAAKLIISRRTVETHVDHIKVKLGLATRAQVVAWAVRGVTEGTTSVATGP